MTTRQERYAAAEAQGREGAACGYNRHNNPYHIVREKGMHEAWERGLRAAANAAPKADAQ